MNDPTERAFALRRLGIIWGARDLNTVLAFAESDLKGVDKNAILTGVSDQAIEAKKFDSALSIIEKMPFSRARIGCISSLATKWAEHDFSSAAKWIASLDSEEHQAAINVVLPVLEKQKDVESLLQIVESSNDQFTKRDGVERVVHILSESGDLNVARQWLMKLPDELRGSALASYVRNSSVQNIDEIGKLVFVLKDSAAKTAATSAIVQKLFMQSPADAAQWVSKAPESVSYSALQALSLKWYSTDSVEFLKWVYSLPKGGMKDSALTILASSVAPSDRASALEVGAQIQDPKKRAAVLQSLKR